jgi:glycosyltransferase involved in cell wall biosynthesis
MDLADRIIPYSDFGATFFRTKSPIQVIKGGVDGGFFNPPEHRPRRDRVLFVGRLLPHKGVDRIIDALPKELPLTVYGYPYNREYERYLRERARGKQVEFTFVRAGDGGDEVIRDLYRRAWVNILPSAYRDCYGRTYAAPELMGLTLLEAMGCGTPAICSRVGGMPEFIRHGETGFIFDQIEELAGYLRLLAEDPALVERMGRAARRSVEQEFDLRVVGAKLVAIYDDLISQTWEVAA